MRTTMKTTRTNAKKTDKARTVERCKLERLKMAGEYGRTPLAAAWMAGLEARQAEMGCALVRRPARPASRRRA